MTKFHAFRPPTITILDYLERICKYACCSPECYVLSLIYIDRLIQRSSFVLNSHNVHRVIITSITLAAKFFDDQFFDNAYYARVGGISKGEMNAMELDFLFLINFSLFVSPSVYNKYFTELSNHATMRSMFCENCSDGLHHTEVVTLRGSEDASATMVVRRCEDQCLAGLFSYAYLSFSFLSVVCL